MKLNPTILETSNKTLAGHKTTMSYSNNLTFKLWNTFMPVKNQLNAANNLLYSLQIYPDNFFNLFNPTAPFDKYALLEVNSTQSIPEGFIKLELPQGLYAVFNYKGTSAQAPAFFQAIFTQWLPQSGYVLDNRPHFEVLGEKYKQNDPDSEEEIWIPIKTKE